MRTALFVAAFDSQLKWCAGIRDELVGRGFRTRVVVPQIRSALSARQIADAGFDGVEQLSWDAVVDASLTSDVVVCGLSGPLVRELTFALSERLTSRPSNPTSTAAAPSPGPVLVTGWVGVIIEKIVAGYVDRSGSDIVAVNSGGDLALFRDTSRRLGLAADNLLLSGLPFLRAEPEPQRTGPVRRVLFADQPTVPSTDSERLYLYRQLIAYARHHPDREVLLKPRHRPGEDTFHRMRYHPEDLLARESTPPNFRIDYPPISSVLPTTDLLLTVSSTACLEALDAGCRVALVLDMGVHERYGNHVFLDSGLLRTFTQIISDDLGRPDPEWSAQYFFPHTVSAPAAIADRAEALLASGQRPSRAVWESEYFVSAKEYYRSVRVDLGGLPAPRGEGPYSAAALRRRQRRHGPVRGTLAHMSSALVPPIVNASLRTVAQRGVRG